MSRLKDLIREIHQRSLWQVLLIYCGAALVAYQAVQAVTEGLGLPQWFPAFAIVLFIVGLPIVLATAFVHEVAPPTVTPEEPTALTEAEAARIEAKQNMLVQIATGFADLIKEQAEIGPEIVFLRFAETIRRLFVHPHWAYPTATNTSQALESLQRLRLLIAQDTSSEPDQQPPVAGKPEHNS